MIPERNSERGTDLASEVDVVRACGGCFFGASVVEIRGPAAGPQLSTQGSGSSGGPRLVSFQPCTAPLRYHVPCPPAQSGILILIHCTAILSIYTPDH